VCTLGREAAFWLVSEMFIFISVYNCKKIRAGVLGGLLKKKNGTKMQPLSPTCTHAITLEYQGELQEEKMAFGILMSPIHKNILTYVRRKSSEILSFIVLNKLFDHYFFSLSFSITTTKRKYE
jgi:hypothetical protein